MTKPKVIAKTIKAKCYETQVFAKSKNKVLTKNKYYKTFKLILKMICGCKNQEGDI
ncbi:hypothetical protein AGMMS49936_06730 [Endomicrobiia bacterium]|nr:hypothetical protein AGMMS49936_06700 [Endomicrobiia bacterium]GHT46937.1 hypothetical protein AGMMS49936_06730 [Endomicrobiia bacterium]